MYVLMQCVAEAVVAKGVRGLVELVPGGGFLFDVANDAHRRLRDRKRTDQIREEVVAIAAAGVEEVRKVAEQVVQEVAKNVAPAEKAALELYLTQVPGAVRASFRRAEDPSGRSVPDQFALNDGADLARRLPSKLPRFRPGEALPGRPGWELGELLGSGGFGEVWLARNPSLSALKGAVKFGTDPQARERLLRHEGGLVSRVMEEGRHPNIVPLLDAYLEGDTPWLMYEYVSGGELGTLIGAWQTATPADRASRSVTALRTLAAAVGHFHRLRPPLVHRDLKPANILVRGTAAAPQLLVADFGIGGVAADAALAAETARRSSGYLGSQLWGSHTPLYASPQQQRGEKPDPRDDVHALGVIGYQMLTGKLDTAPGADFARTLKRLNVPEPLIELLGDCAAHDPAHRPKDAAELADRLAKLDKSGAAPPAEGPQIVACPTCGVSLRFRAGATALRCTRCSTVFNPSEAAAPVAPKLKVIEAELSPPPPPPAPVTQRPALTVRRPRDDDRPPRRDNDRDRRREPEREPEERTNLKMWLIAGGAVLASLGVILLIVLLTGRDTTTASNTQPTTPTVNPSVTPTPVPTPTVVPVQKQPPVVVPAFPPEQDPGGAIGKKRTFPGKTTPEGDPFLAPAVPQIVAQVRTFTIPALKDKDVEVRYGLDGQTLVAVTPDGAVTLASAVNGAERMSYSSGVKGFKPLVFPQGDQVATALDGKKGLFVLAIGGPIPKTPLAMPKFADVPTTVAMSANGEWVAAGGDQGAVVAWRKGGKELPTLFLGPGPNQRTFAGRVDALGFGDDFSAQLLAASGNTVRTWSGFDWKTTRQLAAEGPVLGFPMAGRQRNTVVATVANRGLTMWEDAATGIGGSPLEGDIKEYAKGAAWGNFFDARYAALGADGKFGFWDGQRSSKIEPEADQPAAADLNFNKEGNLLAVAHLDGSVGLWHVGDGFRRNAGGPKQAVRISDHGGPVTSSAWSPDGKELATVDRTGRVRVWGGMKIDPPGSVPYLMKAPEAR